MIKNTKKYLKESEQERKEFLKSLSIKKGVKILESLLSSQLLSKFITKSKQYPLSLEKSLKHAKLTG